MFVTVLKLNTGYASGVKSVTGPGSYGILGPRCDASDGCQSVYSTVTSVCQS